MTLKHTHGGGGRFVCGQPVPETVSDENRESIVTHRPAPVVSADVFSRMRHENGAEFERRFARHDRWLLAPEPRKRNGAGGLRVDLKEVRLTLDRSQPVSERAGSRVAIHFCAGEVRHTRPSIDGKDLDAVE